MPDQLIEWSVAIQVREGENLSGDHYLVCGGEERVLVAAIDGIGHGPEAAFASHAAAAALKANPDQPLPQLFAACHKALRSTRGVVMSLVAFSRSAGSMAWLGVGNVEGRLLRADKRSSHPEEELLLHSGVVGHDLPSTFAMSVLSVARGDLLILATDGIHREFTKELHIGKSAHQIANDILARHSKGTDDALVVVAKVRGGGP